MIKLILAVAIACAACSASKPSGEPSGAERGDSNSGTTTIRETDLDPTAADPTDRQNQPDASPETPTTPTAPSSDPVPTPTATAIEPQTPQPRVIRFAWQPNRAPAEAYEMSDPADQHRLVLTPGVEPGGEYPVVVGFHGQPKRGTPPRKYRFPDAVQDQVVNLVHKGEIQPVILVLPVFRFIGGNWPWMDARALRSKVEELLAAEKIAGANWYAFGHSGAAGCRGDGLNRAHRMRPKAVGFFDTCLGQGWVDQLEQLRQRKIRALNVHSVETAGFQPRQHPEYQSGFNFGRAYGPAGLKPITCPKKHPGARLREQKFRCAASADGLISAFVVDTGEGALAHVAVVEPALHYFLTEFAGLAASGD